MRALRGVSCPSRKALLALGPSVATGVSARESSLSSPVLRINPVGDSGDVEEAVDRRLLAGVFKIGFN
jgi:hypothetical protein